VKVGDVVAERYEIADVIGRGGMSSVYRAHDRVLERDVALKVLHERFTSDPEHVERFRREARAIARLSHPNVVTVIDRGQVDECEFIVFELVRGQDLKELLASRGPLPVTDALALAHQAARGLAFAHEHGIVHRDVKPQNVLVNEDGVAKVTDFGIARSLGPDDGLTLTGTIMGTGDYFAPEQALGRPADARSDQYSLGALLYELITGEVPYPAEGVLAVAARHVNDPVPSVREKRPDVSPRVDALVRRAMAKAPEERFPSTDALIAALEACMAEEAASARPSDEGATAILPAPPAPSAAQRVRAVEPPRARRRRRVPWALLAGLAVLAAGAAVVWALATERFIPGEEEAGGRGAAVRLAAAADYDPEGDDVEHPELLAAATDGNPATFWRTETYDIDFQEVKSGVGIVLDARQARELDRLTIVTDTPGFTAVIQAADSPEGTFAPVSDKQTVEEETTFDLRGAAFRYYLIWITNLEEVAHVNEVRAE
jgi:eukaryotic-like serine/threonine-protein kinase